MSGKLRKQTPVPKVFHFKTISQSLVGLQFNVERDLKKRSLKERDRDTAAGLLLMRIAALFTKELYDAIRFLCSDEETKGRRPEYVFAVPSIVRTMQEILFTIIYIGEDFPDRARTYYKASWREHMRERAKYCNEHSTKPEYKSFLANFKKGLKEGAKKLDLTEEEAKHWQSLPSFPVGMHLLRSMNKANQPFAKWLTNWFYDETSAIAHFTPLGTIKMGGFLIHDMVAEGNAKELADESLKRFKSFHVIMATIVLICTASELEQLFNLGNREQIVNLWELIRLDFPDAIEVCTRRYDKLLNMR